MSEAKVEVTHKDWVALTAVVGTLFSVGTLMSIHRTEASVFGVAGVLMASNLLISLIGGALLYRVSSPNRLFYLWRVLVNLILAAMGVYLCLYFAMRLETRTPVYVITLFWFALSVWVAVALFNARKTTVTSTAGQVNSKVVAMGPVIGIVVSGWLLQGGGELYFLVGLNFILASICGLLTAALWWDAYRRGWGTRKKIGSGSN